MGNGLAVMLKKLKDKRCAVLGMGVSNIPLIRMLVSCGTSVSVFDKTEEPELSLVNEFEKQGVSFSFGKNYLANLEGFDVIFKTPGMRYDLPELLSAERNGSVVTTEMEQFLKLCTCNSIGITGSDGKTTTTTVIGKLLERAGKTCHVGGNIGRPLLSDVDDMTDGDFAIVELSSFQLMNIKVSPQISVITNVTPNHLDVHKSFDEYIEAKKEIFKHSSGKVVLNYDNEVTKAMAVDIGDRCVFFSSKTLLDNGFCLEDGCIVRREDGKSKRVLAISDIKIPGMHNVENYMAAIAATEGFVSLDDIVYVAKNFGGVEHRMELVRELSGVKYYNDSIASSPTRTVAGLRAFNQKVILIAGGYDKKIPFDELANAATDHIKTLILVGATAEKIRDSIVSANGYDEKKLPIMMCESFEEAVNTAHNIAKAGDIVTLSPACASFDLFKNFMERGNRFKELVNSLV